MAREKILILICLVYTMVSTYIIFRVLWSWTEWSLFQYRKGSESMYLLHDLNTK